MKKLYRSRKEMVIAGIFLSLLLAATVPVSAQTSPTHVDWIGSLEIEGKRDVLRLYFEPKPESPWARFSSRREISINLENVVFQPDQSLSFEIRLDDKLLTFEGRAWEKSLAGIVHRGEQTGSFQLTPVVNFAVGKFDQYASTYEGADKQIRLFFREEALFYYLEDQQITRLYPISEKTFFSERDELINFSDPEQITIEPYGKPVEPLNRVQFYTEEAVSFSNGDVNLAGTLLEPLTPGPHPVLVFTHGSQTNERNWYYNNAYFFVQNGFAALVYDKRGSGKSSGNTETASIYDLANDAIAAMHYLQTRDDIISSQIGLWGLSQGGTIVSVAASRSRDVSFILSISGMGGTFIQQELYNMDNKFRYAGFSDKLRDTGQKFWKLASDLPIAVRDGRLPDVFGVRDTLGMDIPLEQVWESVSQPALIIYGEKDSLVPTADSAVAIRQALEKGGNRNYAIHIFPNASHGLMQTETGSRYERENTFAPGWTDLMTAWARQQIKPSTELPSTRTQVSAGEIQPSGDFEENGRFGPVRWYGRAPFQFGLLLVFLLTSLSGLISFWFRKKEAGNVLTLASSLATLIMVGGFLALVAKVLSPDYPQPAPGWVNLLPMLGLLTVGIAIASIGFTLEGLLSRRWKAGTRLYMFLVSMVNLLLLGWLYYWNLLGFAF